MNFDTDTSHDAALAANVNQNVRESGHDIANQYSSGNAEARGLLNAPDNTNKTLAYGDEAMSRAIQSKYMGQFNRDQNQLKTSIIKNADADHLRNLQVTTQAAGQEVELNRQKQLLAWKIHQANKRARGQVLGNILGIVGTVGGAVAGGMLTAGVGAGAGAATGAEMMAGIAGGASAGNALGSGIGQMYGENN